MLPLEAGRATAMFASGVVLHAVAETARLEPMNAPSVWLKEWSRAPRMHTADQEHSASAARDDYQPLRAHPTRGLIVLD